jgi:hypothetical protein
MSASYSNNQPELSARRRQNGPQNARTRQNLPELARSIQYQPESFPFTRNQPELSKNRKIGNNKKFNGTLADIPSGVYIFGECK